MDGPFLFWRMSRRPDLTMKTKAPADVDGDGLGGARQPIAFGIFQKLALIAALSTLPAVVIGSLYVRHVGGDIAAAELECRGLTTIVETWPRFRALLAGANAGLAQPADNALLGTVEQQRVAVAAQAMGGRLAIVATRDVISRVADNSRLSVDPDLSVLRAIEVITTRVPELAIAAYDVHAAVDLDRQGQRLGETFAAYQQVMQSFRDSLNAADALYFDAVLGERLAEAQNRLNEAWGAFKTRTLELAAGLDDMWDDTGSLAPEYDALLSALSDFWDNGARSVALLLEHRVAVLKGDQRGTVILGLGLVLIAGLLVWLVAQSITQRIAALNGVMDRMRRGELDLIVPHWRGRDEIGAMARAVKVFRNALAEKRRADAALIAQNEVLGRKKAELQTQNVRFNAAINHMSQGLVMFDGTGHLIVCNQRFAEIYGLPADLVAPGVPQRRIVEHILGRLDRRKDPIGDPLTAALDAREAGEHSTQVVELGDGRVVFVQHRMMPGEGWVSTHEDITERRRVETQIVHMAHHDALTGLPNRVLFREKLAEALARRRPDRIVAVLYLDLDQFKGVNDTLGHPVGDALLRAVAGRLKTAVREGAIVARLSGDEFAIVDGDIVGSEDAAAIARRLVEVVSQPYEVDDHQLVVGTSIGIALAPIDGDNGDQLLRNADMALYRAKGDGRGTHRFFEAEMDVRLQARRQLEIDLRGAMERGEFSLFYQPLIKVESGEVTGFEALLRWKHPKRGMVSPAEFVPVCEDIGMIVPLGEWVLRTACAEAATWPEPIKVAVNLSPAQFRGRRLVEAAVGALSSSGLRASRLELEITESVLLQDNEATLATLHQLRAIGVRISMDDFGTGYSSLSYLRSFPFDKLKIDQTFIRDLLRNDDSVAIIRAVVSLGRSLGMATTAEGVETPSQLEIIRDEGCTEAQGYLFSQPQPASEVLKFVRQRNGRGRKAA